jgi:thiopeptide-type bacteriocin biosynthesis protein
VNLLTRFCRDQALTERVQAHLRAEEALEPEKRFAEIIHLPEGRAGNVICRPDLGRLEIPLMATPGVPSDRQIPLSDLSLSVQEDRIVLRSRRLGVEVLPRLTCAHNFAHDRSWKVYKFLGLLQYQGRCAELFFDWGAAREEAFLPRVSVGSVVVSLARWRIKGETASHLSQGRLQVEQWREAHQVPRLAFIAEGDQQLLIDFDNPLAVDTFLDQVRKQTETVVVEQFPRPEALLVRGPEGRFVHEMVLPFVRKSPCVAQQGPARDSLPAVAGRVPSALQDLSALRLEPGSQWLYAKLYCSPSHADLLLAELIRPLVEEVSGVGAAKGWFFIRYADPEWHLRLRLRGDPAALTGFVLPELVRRAQFLCRDGLLWHLSLERYEPEVARYGGLDSIGLAERLFQFDSELALQLVPLVLNDEGAQLRWKLAFCGADRLMAALGLDTVAKKALVEQLRGAREQAWITDGAYRQQVARAFRALHGRQTLEAVLDGTNDAGLLPPEAMASFQRFEGQLQILRQQWRDLEETDRLGAPLPEIAASLVHMHLNRLLRSCHLEQEAILCGFLGRIYATRLARQRRA